MPFFVPFLGSKQSLTIAPKIWKTLETIMFNGQSGKKLSMYMRRRIWDSVFDISVGVYFLFGVYFVLGVCKFCIWEGVFGI